MPLTLLPFPPDSQGEELELVLVLVLTTESVRGALATD